MHLAFEPSSTFLWGWGICLIVALALTLFVAVLLLQLVMAGFALNKHARIADIAAKPVRANVQPVPQLAETLSLIREITSVARVAEQHGAQLEQVLGRNITAAR